MRGKRSAALEISGRRTRPNRVVVVVRRFRGLARMRQIPKVLIFLIAGALVAEPAYPQAVTALVDGFETGTIQSTLWNESSTGGCSATVPSGGASEGTYYLRSTLTANPPTGGNYRCEQNARGVGENTPVPSTRYYHFALRVPSNFANDNDAGDTVMQLHYGAGSGGHYAIKIVNTSVMWVANGISGGSSGSLGALVKGQWVEWCTRVDWRNNNTGLIKVWRNPSAETDTPTFQQNNITTVPTGLQAGKFKIGLYKSVWRTNNFPNPFNSATSPRVVEHDDVRMGLTFAEACGGGTIGPEPPSSVTVE